MSDNVIPWRGDTKCDAPVSTVLEATGKDDLETVLVIGWCKDGAFYMRGSTGLIADNLYMVELARKELLSDE